MPRDPTHTSSGPHFDPEEALWAEIIRYEVDSWNPRWLPHRFQPRSRRGGGRWAGSLPQVVAVCVLVLVVAALSGFNGNIAGVRDNLIGIHPAANHAGRGHGGAPAFRDTLRPSRSSGLASSARTGSTPTGAPSPATSPLGTASGPRMISPAASAEPPMPTSSPPDLPVPSARTPRLPQVSPPPPPAAQPGGFSPDERAGSAGRRERSPGQ
jgi:hypothetical protein